MTPKRVGLTTVRQMNDACVFVAPRHELRVVWAEGERSVSSLPGKGRAALELRGAIRARERDQPLLWAPQIVARVDHADEEATIGRQKAWPIALGRRAQRLQHGAGLERERANALAG